MFTRTFICFLLLFFVVGRASQLRGQPAESAQASQSLLAAARQARDQIAIQLRTGYGVGAVRHSQVERGQVTPTTFLDADIQVYFEMPKFHLRVQYATRLNENLGADVAAGEERWIPTNLAEQVVIFDGETTYSVEFTKDGKCHGDVYFDFNCQNVLRSAGMPFENPIQLWPLALDIDRRDLEQAKLTRLAGGGLMGVLTKESYRIKFYFLEDFAYDLRRVSSYRTGEEVPFRDTLLQWQESNGVQYVKRFVSRVSDRPDDAADASGLARRELEVEYKSLEANVPVDVKQFGLSSVAIPIQTEFDDHRFNVDGKPKVLWFDGTTLRESTE